MPTPVLLLTVATLLPLAAFVILLFVGKRMGDPLAGWVGTVAIATSFVLAMVAAVSWMDPPKGVEWGMGKNPIVMTYHWVPTGTASALDVGVQMDSLTVAMFNMITLVATLVHIFSIGYMRGDKRFPRFFTYLGLFGFSMLGLVLGGTLLQLFIFWELVGLCSYLLIGFWYEKKSASNAAIKAFVVNRVGDMGFIIGFGILFYHVGNITLVNLAGVLGSAGGGGPITLADGSVFGAGLLTIMGIGLFCGAIGKSAQFPLHVWLPDAMEGPTPVSALIHAATMVAAGVYLVARIFPILTPDAKLFIAVIGVTTLTMAALIACVQSDIKKVLAYSTLSQLGYMIMAMGTGSWVGGLFHLITHAFFKALLFLGSGSVIYAAHHEQELGQYGGLIRKIPITGITFAIACLAIAGTGFAGIGFSGYYSKDMILAHAGAFASLATSLGHSGGYWLFFILPAVIAYVTAFYMTRCWMLTFWGKPRNQEVYDHAHESPIMWFPLVVLAALSVIGGSKLLSVQDLLENSTKEVTNYCQKTDARAAPFATEASTVNPADRGREAGEAEPAPRAELTPPEKAQVRGHELVEKWVTWAFAVGIGLGFLIYLNGYAVADRLYAIAPLRWIHVWLYRRMYFDELYSAVFVGFTVGLAYFCGAFDKYIIDGLVNLVGWLTKFASMLIGLNDKYVVDGAANGSAWLSGEIGAAARSPQTGRVRVYVTVLLVTVALGLAGATIVVLAR